MADEFRINEAYAEKYNKWREKEELQKLKDKYGDIDNEDIDSSSSESEDEDAEALTPQLEKDWLRTLSAIKSKDPKIYKKDYTFFEEKEKSSSEEDKKEAKKKTKPMFLKDYERKVILEKDGKITDSSEDEDEDEAEKPPGYYEEQEEIKQSFKKVMNSDSDTDEDFLTKRKKSKEEEEKEEEEYIEWLKGNRDSLSNDKKAGVELDPLKDYWADPKLADKEKFLRDYILNKQYLDEDEERIPTYDEIVEENISEEENIIEKQEEFERKYNFRYEEPDPEFIKSYPRTIGDSVRRKKEKRAQKRKEAKERKQKEKDKKKEEIKKLKNLKKNEILNKLDHLKEVTGNESIGFTNDDIDGDFDPSKHDEIMKKVFSQDYYDDLEGDVTKPVFSDDEELGLADENWDEWTGPTEGEENYDGEDEEYYEPHCEDPDFNMDADFDPTQDRSFGLDGRSKKKKKSKFKQAVERKKPVFDPNEKTFEEYFDEYYKLDYEDIIGDQPCRFKYRQTQANDFGLSTEEILGCKDKELNTWVSVKKMSQYRTQEEEAIDSRIYKKKSRNTKHKMQILTSLQEQEEEKFPEVKPSTSGIDTGKVKTLKKVEQEPRETEDNVNGASQSDKNGNKSDPGKNKPKHKNKSKKRKISESEQDGLLTKKPKKTTENTLSPKKQIENDKRRAFKKKKKVKNNNNASSLMSDERLKAYGIDPKKFKYTHGKKAKQSGSSH